MAKNAVEYNLVPDNIFSLMFSFCMRQTAIKLLNSIKKTNLNAAMLLGKFAKDKVAHSKYIWETHKHPFALIKMIKLLQEQSGVRFLILPAPRYKHQSGDIIAKK